MHADAHRLLWDARRAADRVTDFTRGRTFFDYEADELLRSAVERQLGVVGEALAQLRRKHATNRPTKRVALERHIPSLLGGEVRSPATVQAVMAGLEKRGIVEFSDKAIKYRIPAA